MQYRCPIDDVVFGTVRIDRAPTLKGHPECPGPECRKRFGAAAAAAAPAPVVAAPAPVVAAPVPSQDFSPAEVTAAANLGPAPVGQDW